MSITLKEALTLDILQQTRVIAGRNGLDRTIRWISILEVLDEINFLQEGDLLVTTAYGLIDNPQLTASLVPFLAERKLAGLAIQTGYYLHAVPPELIRQCDYYDLPLLELPKSIAFTELTKIILKKVINTQVEMLEYNQRIRHRFTQVILKNEGLGQIAGVLSELLTAPVCIFDKDFNLLASAGVTDDNLPLLQSVRSRKFPLAGLDQKDAEPLVFPLERRPDREKDESSHVLQPLIAGNKIYGFISAFSLDRRFNDMEMSALATAATTCTLEMLKASAVQEAEDRVKGDFLDDLLEDRVSSREIIHRRANYLGFDLAQNFLIMGINIDDFGQLAARNSEAELQEIKRRLFFAVRSCVHFYGWKALLKYHSDKIIVLLQIAPNAKDIETVRQLAERMLSTAKGELAITISIGIGRACSELIGVADSYREANQALSMSKKLWKKDHAVFYADLGIYKLFTNTENDKDIGDFYRETAAALVDYDRKHNIGLTRTLEVFVESNGGIKETAERLFIHRHTLTYRLSRIREITGLNPEDCQDLFRLHLGMIVARLLGHL